MSNINRILEGVQAIPFQKKNSAALSKVTKALERKLPKHYEYKGRYRINIIDPMSKIYGMGGLSGKINKMSIYCDYAIDFSNLEVIQEGNTAYIGINTKKPWLKLSTPTVDDVYGMVKDLLEKCAYNAAYVFSNNPQNLDPLSADLEKDLKSASSTSDYTSVFTNGVVDMFDSDKTWNLIKIAYSNPRMFKNVFKKVEQYVVKEVVGRVPDFESDNLGIKRKQGWFPKLSNETFFPIVVIDVDSGECWAYSSSTSKSYTAGRGSKNSLDTMNISNSVYLNLSMIDWNCIIYNAVEI